MSLRAYRRLLRLLPADFRREYGDEMCRVVGEHWRVVRGGLGVGGSARFWWRQTLAVVRAAITSRRGGTASAQRATLRRRARLLPSERIGNSPPEEAMDGWLQDLRYSVRSLLKRPGFAAVTVATLALGIGASTAIFSAVHAVLFRSLPYGEAEGVVVVFHHDELTGERGGGLSAANARDLSELATTLSAVAVSDPYSLDLQVDGRAETVRTWAVTRGFFDIARVQPYLGRTFTADEYEEGGAAVAMLGYRSWMSRFGGDPEIVGETLTFDVGPVTVVGILPPDFKLPDEKEIWVPRPIQPWDVNSRAADYMMGVARLAPGATLAQAQAEATRIAASLQESYPRLMANTTFRLVPLGDYLLGDVRTPLLVLMGAVGFVLLIACANVTGLMLARGGERQKEYALRGALGAGTGRLVRQVTIDSLILAVLGCAVGIGITYVGVNMIRAIGPDHMPRIEEIAVDRSALLFAVVVAGLSAIISGLAPSLRFSHPDLRDTLGDGGRGVGGSRSRTLRNGIVVAEVAAAMVLLIGAGLLSRSFGVLLDRDLGFDPDNRLVMQLFAYGYGEDGGMTREQFVLQTIDEIEALPGVRRVALTTTVPGATDGRVAAIDIDLPFTIDDRPRPDEGMEPQAWVSIMSEGYPDVMDMRLVAGRAFTAADDTSAPPAILVNEAFVRRHLPDSDPIGAKITIGFGERASREIIGVVGDVLPSGYESEPRAEVYFGFRQLGGEGVAGNLTFVIEADIEAEQLTNPVKEAVWRVNPTQAVWAATTLEVLLADWMKQRTFNLLLLSSFAVIALVLAGIGIYGLISFSVQQRIAEMGIRRALGGQRGSILGMVVRDAQLLAGAGVLIGVLGALALTRFIQGMLYGVDATDPTTFVVLAIAVFGVAAMAAIVPGVRAMRVDPIVALRTD